jgi:hypothetical protein
MLCSGKEDHPKRKPGEDLSQLMLTTHWETWALLNLKN